ncbi:MAG: zinc transporter ZntB [Alphaproteobacteria bacterium]|nr:zinc transporter ZntB [Alphaproteobacteria bacterium]
MATRTSLTYGAVPGLRFACVLDGSGGCIDLDWDGVRRWKAEDGTLWVHLERDDADAQNWLRNDSGVDPVIADALLAAESRPRVEEQDDALLVFLRGVNRNAKEDPYDLVPIHMWISANRLISLRDKAVYLLALRDIREALAIGRGPRTVGELFVLIGEKVVKYVEPILDELDEEADRLDEEAIDGIDDDWRAPLAGLRRRAIELRRYLSPQREALFRLQVEEAIWLNRRDRVHLREITDRVMRYVEGLDVIRDRATILHEDMTAQIAERISRTSNRLTAIAAIFLPPSLVAGIFGMNLSGIPAHEHELAFGIVSAVIITLMAVEAWILRRMRWI